MQPNPVLSKLQCLSWISFQPQSHTRGDNSTSPRRAPGDKDEVMSLLLRIANQVRVTASDGYLSSALLRPGFVLGGQEVHRIKQSYMQI